jgi:hypothetical protein
VFEINWDRYNELSKKSKEEMTDDEWEFFRYVYHVEEFRAGLDGD